MYYTVMQNAAAYSTSNIYYAIKVTVPSYADANAYYGNSNMLSGNTVKVTITYRNINGKSKDVAYVQLTNKSQTLWWNGTSFDSTWTQSAFNNCGCGSAHIRTDVVTSTADAAITACIGAQGDIADLLIDGCYKVSKKTFNGVRPCINCAPVNLSGYMFSGDCAANQLFFATNSAGKVTGIYVIPECCGYKDNTVGAIVDNSCDLYGWVPAGTESDCRTNSCGLITYELRELPGTNAVVTTGANGWTWFNRANNTKFWGDWHDDYMNQAMFDAWKVRHPNDAQIAAAQMNAVYALDSKTSKYYKIDNSNSTCWTDDNWTGATWYSKSSLAGYTTATKYVIATNNTTGAASVQALPLAGGFTMVRGSAEVYQYAAAVAAARPFVYRSLSRYAAGGSIPYMFKMTSATSVNCDTNEASYLNAINHMLALLGFTYADVAAGNVFMTNDNLLANFGFSTSVCSTANWGAYTAAITVAPVAEVPATGDVSFLGYMVIGLAAVATFFNRRKED